MALKRLIGVLWCVLLLSVGTARAQTFIGGNGTGGGGGGGGVSAVTGTAPITSSGGDTPAIGITLPLPATDVALPVVLPETSGALGNGVLVGSDPTPGIVTNGSNTSATPTAPSVITAAANDWVISAFVLNGTNTFTGPSTPTNRENIAGATGKFAFWVGDQTVSTKSQVAAQAGSVTAEQYGAASIVLTGGSPGTFVGCNAQVVASSTANTVNVPSGVTNGDLLVGIVGIYTAATPAGTFASAFTLDNHSTAVAQTNVKVYYRIASSEPASYTINSTSASGTALAICDYRGPTGLEHGISTISGTGGNTFTNGDVGKYVCEDGVSATTDLVGYNEDLCGTISTFTSANLIVPSFDSSIQGSSSPDSAVTLQYGTDDSSAFQTAINSCVSTGSAGSPSALASGGCTLQLSQKNYVIAASGLSIPNNVTVNIQGVGAGVTKWGFSSLSNFYPSQRYSQGSGSWLWFLTKSLATAGITMNPGSNNSQYSNMTHDVWANFGMWAGAGINWDAGGGDGIDLTNVVRFTPQHLVIGNFVGDGIKFATSGTAGSTAYNTIEDLIQNYILGNGGTCGIEVDVVLTSGGFTQDFELTSNDVENNAKEGFCLKTSAGSQAMYNLVFDGSNIFQRDDVSGTSTQYEIDLSNAVVTGCTSIGTYFEKDTGSISNMWNDPSSYCTHIGESSGTGTGFNSIPSLQAQYTINPPVALATLPTCAATFEGAMATQNNSTSTCNAGTTATSSGTTHCQVRCNGTSWIQTGL